MLTSGLPSEPGVAIVHDYLTQHGGAERVVLSMTRAFPGARVHTSLYQPSTTFPEFNDVEIVATGLNRFAALRRNHRTALPLLAQTFSRLQVDAEVVLCSSSGWAHGVETAGRKIVYCHNPARWLYQTDEYLDGRARLARAAAAGLRRRLLDWDRRAAASADQYLVNSSVVAGRVRAAYGIEAEVVPPPHTIDAAGPQEATGVAPGYLLCVSRLLPYKNVEALVEAFRALPELRLVVVGRGPLERRLRARAPGNVTITGGVSDAQLRWLYANSAGLVASSFEDYGLTPLEAAVFGKPSAVLRWGGYLDTVVEGVTGLFFGTPHPASIAGAVRSLMRERWDSSAIVDHAAGYSEQGFIERLRTIVGQPAMAA